MFFNYFLISSQSISHPQKLLADLRSASSEARLPPTKMREGAEGDRPKKGGEEGAQRPTGNRRFPIITRGEAEPTTEGRSFGGVRGGEAPPELGGLRGGEAPPITLRRRPPGRAPGGLGGSGGGPLGPPSGGLGAEPPGRRSRRYEARRMSGL